MFIGLRVSCSESEAAKGQEKRCAPRELDEAEARGCVQRRPALVVARVHVGAELFEQQARELLRALAVRDA